MAFAVETCENVNPFGWAIFGSAKLLRLIPGLAAIGAGVAASAWIVASVSAMYSSAMPGSPVAELIGDAALVRKHVSHSVALPVHPLIHVSKFSRLPGQTTVSDRMVAEISSKSAKDMAALMQRRGLALLAKRNNATQIASALKAQAQILASASPVPAVTAPAVLPAPIQVAPVNAPEPATTLAAAEAQPPAAKAAPIAAPVETALAEGVVSDEPFGLVLSSGNDVPLPMARPAMKAPVAAPEAALAYARTDTDDDSDEMPKIGKPVIAPAARNGVAIYDISAGTVYLPSGERLEAHSGLGAMRDDPRYVDKKMRGPTPPHTYNLAMREALFHGVAAIRLHPVGGPGAIHDRVGLLAHTYMLGKRGDSNGCVSFKDYKRFLAAFKRGEIKQLVVVPKLNGAPTSSRPTLASLFSKRS